MEKGFKKDVIIGVGLILGSILLFLLASGLINQSMDDLTNQISTDRISLAKRTELLSNLAEIKKSTEEANLYRQKINALMPTQDQLLNFPGYLSSLASSHNVSESFSFRGSPSLPEGNTPGAAFFAIDLNGSFENIVLFLGDMEARATKFLVNIDDFNISASSGGGNNFSMHGRVFFRK